MPITNGATRNALRIACLREHVGEPLFCAFIRPGLNRDLAVREVRVVDFPGAYQVRAEVTAPALGPYVLHIHRIYDDAGWESANLDCLELEL